MAGTLIHRRQGYGGRVKRKSRPQIRRRESCGGAAKAVAGKHNPKVAGSNPAPATT